MNQPDFHHHPQLGWSGVAVERRTIHSCQKPELASDHHFLILWLDQVSEGLPRAVGPEH